MDLKDKLKKFFTDKLNLAIMILAIFVIVLAIIPYNAVWYMKMMIIILAVDSGLLGWKMLLRHRANKQVYDVIDYSTQEENKNVFSKVTGTFNTINRKSYLMYSLCFFALAILMVVYVFTK